MKLRCVCMRVRVCKCREGGRVCQSTFWVRVLYFVKFTKHNHDLFGSVLATHHHKPQRQ
jgi:hypothetical protein